MDKKENINFWKQDLKDSSDTFKTPELYFDDLENKILNKTILAKKAPKTKISLLYTWLTIGLASAAALIIAFIMLFTQNNNTPVEFSFEDDIEQFAYFGDEWIDQELADLPIGEDDDSFIIEDIDYLIEDGVTNDEILAFYN